MIVYIIPGKTKNVQDAYDYISDKDKTAKDLVGSWSEYARYSDLAKTLTYEEFRLTYTDGFQHALNYIKNENKVGGYVSGYLCHPDLAEEEFAQTKIKNLRRVGKKLEDDDGNYYYHIIQSFPKELEISDDEVHACGLELVRRLGLYQAIVASHVHPEIKEDELIHGEQKHNHIILNSHIFHEFVDEKKPYKMKYHDCNETYAQLQLINDQIAIEHGLPIIAKSSKDHVSSRYEASKKQEGISWKEWLRLDISNCMRVSSDYDSYEQGMIAAGYQLRTGVSKEQGPYVTYICPNGKKIRDFRLGSGYTKSELEKYWKVRNAIANVINKEYERNKQACRNRIEQILETTTEPLFIKFNIGLSDARKQIRREQNLNIKNSYTNYLPLAAHGSDSNAVLSYFDANKTYEIVNVQYHKLTQVSGQDILDYYRRVQEQELREKREEEQRRKEQRYKDYYSQRGFVKSTSHEPYRIGRYDKDGRERTVGELILILAIVIIENEFGRWSLPYDMDFFDQEYRNDPIYATKDWKVQQMADTIALAREEKINSAIEIDERCNQVGKEVAKSDAEIRRLNGTIERIKPLIDAIEEYQKVKEICEGIHTMSDGPEKVDQMLLHHHDLTIYNEQKAIMHRFKVTSDNEIQDIQERFEGYIDKLASAQEQHEKFSQQYQRIKKLKYNLQLAQNKHYCYGPLYQETLDETIQDVREKQIQSPKRYARTAQVER